MGLQFTSSEIFFEKMDSWVDYIIFIALLLGSLAIGIYHAFTGGRQRTEEEFIMGNRKMKVLPTAISLIVSHKSALSLVGNPAEMFTRGIAAWPGYSLGNVLATIVAANWIVPWVYAMKLTSIYHYFRARYGTNAIQIFSASLGLLYALLYNGIGLFAPSLALEIATGFPVKASMPILAGVCIIYTSMGGMKAVIWTDVFQSLVMMTGILTVLIKAMMINGGITEVFKTFNDEGRIVFDFSPDPTVRHTFWGFIFGFSIFAVAPLGFQQASVQRYSAVPTLREAKIMMYIFCLGNVIMTSTVFLMGIAVFAYYAKLKCDPLESGLIKNPNQIISLFVRDVFHGSYGFNGLFLATIYSATLSTISSTLSGASANAWRDIIQPRWPHLSERMGTIICKSLVIVFGVLSTVFAFAVSLIPGPLVQVAIALMGSCNGPLLGMFLLGGLRIFRGIKWKAVLIGGICGFACVVWLNLGAAVTKKHPPLPPVSTEGCASLVHVNGTYEDYHSLSNSTTVYQDYGVPRNVSTDGFPELLGLERFYAISYIWYTFIGMLVTILTAFISSPIFGNSTKDDNVSEHLFLTLKPDCISKIQYNQAATTEEMTLKSAQLYCN